MKKAISFILSLFLVFTTASCNKNNENNEVKEYEEMNKTFYNPLANSKGLGDPDLFYHDGMYYFTFSQGARIMITRSKHMTQLTPNLNDDSISKIIFTAKSINVIQIWAPEIFFFNGYWYVYFTASKDSQDELEIDTNRRTYVMKSKTDDAFGEWNSPTKLELPDDYRSIDATFFDYNSKQYVIWAGWPNATNSQYRQHLYISELVTNDPTRVKDGEIRNEISVPENIWETSDTIQNEGPFAIVSPNGKPIIFFSGNYSGNDSYCIGYLSYLGGDLKNKDSWKKCDEPFMKTDMGYSEVIAPGHCSVTYSPDGSEYWMCYHSAKYSGAGWDRMARLQKIDFKNDLPYIEHIEKIADEVVLPSGEKVNRVKYEAENATLTEDCYILDKEGYASKDKCVAIEGDGKITFEADVPENGQYCIGVRYSNRDSSETSIKAIVNGDEFTLFAPNTQYDDSFSMAWFYTDLYIKRSGKNVIEIMADSSIYIDCIIIDYLDR